MPLYDFQCLDCGHRFEELVKIEQTPRCPACQSSRTQQQHSFSAVVSTASSREKALKGARQRAKGIKQEKDRAHQEYLRHHMDDH